MAGDWFDQNPQVWQPPQQPQGQPGAGAEMPPAQAPQAAPTWSPGAKAGQKVTLLGFDSDKLNDPNSGSAAGSKYTPAAKAFAAGLGQDVGLSRGGLDNMVNYLKANGFQNATSDGKQKIDFGDGNGLIDVIRSDGQIVFQNTTGNPTWEGKGYKPDAGGRSATPTLGSIGQSAPPVPMGDIGGTPAPNPYMAPMDPTGVDIGTQAPPTLDQYSQALKMSAPQTVQGPQALKIPGFAGGVQDFAGGPAIVGEQGPELVNLPKGSDVIPNGALPGMANASMPFDGGDAKMPSLGGDIAFGGGGANLPGLGAPSTGQVNFGGGGANLPQAAPDGGGSVNFGGGGGMPQARDMAPGGGAAAPLPGAAAGPQINGGFNYNPMQAPQDFNPSNVAGPDRLTLGSIGQPGAVNAQQVGPGQQVNAGTVQTGQAVNAERVANPSQVSAERIQGPAALQAQQLGPAQQQSNLSADQLQLDPSYQFRLNQSLGAIQNSAAAKGMLHSPNVLSSLRDTAGQAASQEYAAANARNLGVQQQNFQNEATVAGANNAANAQAYGLTNQYQQQAALANQQTGLQAQLANQQANQQAGMFNAGQGQSAQQFNSAQQQQANLANVGNQLQAGQFNSQQRQQAALANQGANLQAGQFNANMGFQTQQANLANQLAAYQAYQPLAQQNAQFNAGQQATANQNNFANRFSVNQANNAGSLGAFNANLGAELGRAGVANQQGQLALGNRSADQSYDLGLRNNALGYYGAQNSYNLGLGNLGVSQGQLGLAQQGQQYNQDANTFNTNYGIYRDNRDTAFNQDLARTQVGANAAGNYGNQAGALYANQGQANAGAATAAGQANAGALGNIGNIAGTAVQNYTDPYRGYR